MKSGALQNKKVLYLDYDGVLHHSAVMAGPGSPAQPILDEAGYSLFQYLPALEKLMPDDVVIVLSTSWANLPKHSTNWAKAWLSPAMQNKVVGRTGDVWVGLRTFRQMPRGHQVMLHANQFTPLRWIALDDDSNGFDAIPHHYIKTHWRDGVLPVLDRLQEVFDNWSKN